MQGHARGTRYEGGLNATDPALSPRDGTGAQVKVVADPSQWPLHGTGLSYGLVTDPPQRPKPGTGP